jgi:hypothetical protein
MQDRWQSMAAPASWRWFTALRTVIPTQKFNGYGDQVAGLYTGLDLAKNY